MPQEVIIVLDRKKSTLNLIETTRMVPADCLTEVCTPVLAKIYPIL